jgi:DNA-binding winged helix-turn-helix (wHTH) protein/predicted ATPase
VGTAWGATARESPGSCAVCFGRYRLDPAQGLTRGTQEVRLTPKALSVLRVLAERAGQVVTKEELFRAAWPGTAVSDSALTSCIQELRHALGDDARHPRFIETMHRRGYRFRPRTTADPRGESVCEASTPPPRPPMPLVGREAVLERMRGACRLADRGRRQLLFVTGEPGVGKTTVVAEFLATATGRGAARATWGQCVEHYGAGEPYQPLFEALTRLCRQPGGDEYVEALQQYAPTWLAQLPGLLPPARQSRLQRTIAGTTRERMLRELIDAVEAMTARVSLVLCLEDLHWSDASTLDWIAAFAQRPEPARLLLIGTYRSSEADGTEHPLAAVADGLRVKGCCSEIALGGLHEGAVVEYVGLRFPAAPGSMELEARLARFIHRHTEGNPLFMVTVLGDLVGRGLLAERDGEWTVRSDLSESELGIPDDVRRMIEGQVDRIHPVERGLLEVASVAGAVFSAAAVAAGAQLALDDVERTLTALARHRRFLREAAAVEWPDGTIAAGFEFLHAVYRDVLYQRLPAGRRAELHRLLGAREETAYGERAREVAAELAMHFEQSRDLRRAAVYLEHAARNAQRRGAYQEARMHFEHALALLECQPAGRERTEREVVLRIGLGAVAMSIHGWGAPEVEEAYVRARTLCRELGETQRLFPALWGLWLFYWGRGPLKTAHELSERLLFLARQGVDDALLLQAHHASWATAFSRGDFEGALAHASAGLRLYEADRHGATAETYGNHDAAVCGRYFKAWALAFVGRTAEAARESHEAIASARAVGNPFSLALAHAFAAAVDQTRGDAVSARQHAADAITLAREQGFRVVLAWASALAGWASLAQGSEEEGWAQIRHGIAETRATGSAFLPHFLGLLAGAQLGRRRLDAGLAAIDEALGLVQRTGERFPEAELHRLRGELLLAASSAESARQAERVFGQAIAAGRSQGARLLVLRAAISLGRLWVRLGRGDEARRLIHDALQGMHEPPPSPDAKEIDAWFGDEARRDEGPATSR